MPAQNKSFLSFNPHPHDAAIFVVVIVACCSDPSPDESGIGQHRAESCQERRAWQKQAGDKIS